MARIQREQQVIGVGGPLSSKQRALLLTAVMLILMIANNVLKNKKATLGSGGTSSSLRVMSEVVAVTAGGKSEDSFSNQVFGSKSKKDAFSSEVFGQKYVEVAQEYRDNTVGNINAPIAAVPVNEPIDVVPVNEPIYVVPVKKPVHGNEPVHVNEPAHVNKPLALVPVHDPIAVAPSSYSNNKITGGWKNRYNVVHVLSTRLMQLQPDLMHLGKARIELFKTFTLRSMREQSTQEFLWIIFTDPKLDSELLNELVALVKIHPNFLLVGTNANFKGLRDPNSEIDPKSVFSGDIELFRSYQKAAQTHVYVESRIDADDSIYQEFMANVQRQAQHNLILNNKSTKNKVLPDDAVSPPTNEFRVFCAWHYLEWGYFNPWNKESTKGHLFGVSSPQFCVTPGLTYAFQIGVNPKNFQTSHYKLDKVYPQCNSIHNSNCIDRVEAGKYKYVVLRSRTPTSAGMAGVVPTDEVTHSKVWEAMQDAVWDQYILRNFGITPRAIWATRQYLANDMEHILQDALNGQCSRAEFTCKEASKTDLMNILNEVKKYSGNAAMTTTSNSNSFISISKTEEASVEAMKSATSTASKDTAKTAISTSRHGSETPSSFPLWQNKNKVVHVLWSRFMQLQPDLLHLGKARIELFKTFTLRSIEEQSNQEFLWLIFTDPKLNPQLLNELVGLIQGRPNIVLIGMNSNFSGLRPRDPSWIDKPDVVIFSGDVERVKDYQKAAQENIYLESRIDADDAVYLDFMENVQQQAVRSFLRTTPIATRNATEVATYPTQEFRVFCPEHHLEWGYFNPWNKDSTKGHLFGVTSPSFCISAGLTYAFQVGIKPEDIKASHFKLDKRYPQCHKTAKNKNCVDRIDAGKHTYVIIRSRTPTSAGMAGVIPTAEVKSSKQWEIMQDAAWEKYIRPIFGIAPTSIWTLREYLTNDMENILQDALNGQCTRSDFTCKQASQQDLNNLLSEVRLHSSTAKNSVSTSTGR